MIKLHRLNDEEIILNNNHIEVIEETPDTVILLTNDRRYVVKESADEIIDKIVNFQSMIVKKKQISE